MQAIEITARTTPDGKITPLEFTWQGSRRLVTAVGRRWQEAGNLHILVMAPEPQVFELVYETASGRWFLKLPGGAVLA